MALIHGWIGLVASLFVFLIAFTGLTLSFFGELFELQYGDMVRAQEGPPADIADIIRAGAEGHPAGLQTLGVFMPDTRVEGLETALVYGSAPDAEHGVMMTSVDPVSATYKGSFELHDAFAHEFNDFHFSLLMGEWAQIFIAVIGVLMIGFALTGLYLWWPRGGTSARKKIVRLQTDGKLVPRMFNWHGLAGAWLGGLILLFAITGIGLSEPEWLGPLVSQIDEPAEWDARFKQDCGDTITPQQAADQALSAYPGRHISMLTITTGKEAKYQISLRAPGDWNVRFGDVVAEVHARCAGEMWTTSLNEHGAPEIFGTLMLSLHGGHIFGIFQETLTVLTGLALILLSGTGVYVFFKRTLPASVVRRSKRIERTKLQSQSA
ncbi:MAG: PepSY-associated TM helix domain-containing protein [Pseudomonadota bacterium]